MPAKLKKKWPTDLDKNKMEAGLWVEIAKNNDYKAFCRICASTFCIKSEFCKIEKHSESKKHRQNLFQIDKSQMQLRPASRNINFENQSTNTNNNQCQLLIFQI